MKSKTIIKSYCDCGHLSTFHIMWKTEDGSKHFKCFGADRDTFYKTVSKYKLDDDVATELMNNEVVCQCKRQRLVT